MNEMALALLSLSALAYLSGAGLEGGGEGGVFVLKKGSKIAKNQLKSRS